MVSNNIDYYANIIYNLNHMGIADVFKSIHGAVNEKQFVPISTLVDHNAFSEKVYKIAVKYLEVDEEFLICNKDAVFSKYVYYDGLVYCDLYNLDINILKGMLVKERLHKQISSFKKLREEKNFSTLFCFMEKSLLIPSFIKMYDEIPIEGRYEIFVDLYIRSEYGFELFTDEFLNKVFSERKLSKEWAKRMRLFKKEAVKNEAGLIAAFHGYNDAYNPNDSYSWTLSEKIASFFANRFGAKGVVEKKYILPRDIIDYFQARGEQEVILKTNIIK